MGRYGDNALLTRRVYTDSVNDTALELQFKHASGCAVE